MQNKNSNYTANCPHCGEAINIQDLVKQDISQIPAPPPPPAPPPKANRLYTIPRSTKKKECLHCGKSIMVEAKKCRFCHMPTTKKYIEIPQTSGTPTTPSGPTKKVCPDCWQSIKYDSPRCKYCRKIFDFSVKFEDEFELPSPENDKIKFSFKCLIIPSFSDKKHIKGNLIIGEHYLRFIPKNSKFYKEAFDMPLYSVVKIDSAVHKSYFIYDLKLNIDIDFGTIKNMTLRTLKNKKYIFRKIEIENFKEALHQVGWH